MRAPNVTIVPDFRYSPPHEGVRDNINVIVDSFATLEAFDALELRWRELYAADSRAHFFLSWEWIRACLATQPTPWLVLGARHPGGPYLGFLALNYGRFPAIGPAVNRELSLAGMPRADYTGILVSGGAEREVVAAIARHIDSLSWDNFTLNDWADDRIAMLVEELSSAARYSVAARGTTPSPYIKLPSTWEAYVDGLSHATRRTIRAKLRKVEALPDYRLTWSPPGEPAAAISLLLDMNCTRWKKARAKRDRLFGELFRRCSAAGRFLIGTIHAEGKLLAAQGTFIEPHSKTLLGYMMGFNPEYSRLSPGIMLVASSIRYGIANGFRRYDLARGGEGFKLSLCTDVDHTQHVTLTRRGFRTAAVNAGRHGVFAAKGIARSMLGRSA
jgi:CelD/BcsL family acetyltransferase involved in cellulose biosynthesis